MANQPDGGAAQAGGKRYLEVEAKLWVDDFRPVEGRLARLGAITRHPRTFERNIRYEDGAGSLTPAGIVLRLRQDDRVRLTYKGHAESGPALAAQGLQARFEAEVTLDDFATMDLILRRLGFRPAMSYEKYRTTYDLHGVEILLDEMPYGQFVEVEGEPEAIQATLTALGLADNRRFQVSYAVLFEYVRAHLGLTFTDLTFANFEDIHVPVEAFSPPEESPR